VGSVEVPTWPPWTVRDAAAAIDRRPMHLRGEGMRDVPVFDRAHLAVDQLVEGPAVVEEWATTILVPTGWHVRTDAMGNLVMERR
jgi:N-methylhydantoinase A